MGVKLGGGTPPATLVTEVACDDMCSNVSGCPYASVICCCCIMACRLASGTGPLLPSWLPCSGIMEAMEVRGACIVPSWPAWVPEEAGTKTQPRLPVGMWLDCGIMTVMRLPLESLMEMVLPPAGCEVGCQW